MNVLLLLLFLINHSIARDVDYCYVNDDDPYIYMGTKTAYIFVGGSGSQFSSIPNCEPLQFWMIAKNDARYPSKEKIETLIHLSKIRDQIIMNHEVALSGHMCDADLDSLKSWWPNPEMRVTKTKELTSRSINDVRLFARRLQSYFPELLRPVDKDITLNNYVFRTSGSKAAQAEMEIFMEGLFHSKYVLRDPQVTSGEDSLIKTYSNCSRISENNELAAQNGFRERDKFLNSTDFMNVIQNVSRRIGFKHELTTASILMMYDMCRFDKAWEPSKLSRWCAVFSKEDLKIIEYAEDLSYYYSNGYGNPEKISIGCLALLDMVQYFRNLEAQDRENINPRGIFYFTDTMFMLSFLTSLGIKKDDQMLSASTYKDMNKRQWRTSFLAPFNSNLIAVFYRCQDVESPHKVMFYLQEKPLLLEGCQVGLCDWEYLKNKFQRILDECKSYDCYAKSEFAVNHQSIVTLIINMLLIFIWRTKNY